MLSAIRCSVHLHRGNYFRFQAADVFPVLVHLYLEVREPLVYTTEKLFGGDFVFPVVRHTAFGGEDALVVAHPDARPMAAWMPSDGRR